MEYLSKEELDWIKKKNKEVIIEEKHRLEKENTIQTRYNMCNKIFDFAKNELNHEYNKYEGRIDNISVCSSISRQLKPVSLNLIKKELENDKPDKYDRLIHRKRENIFD